MCSRNNISPVKKFRNLPTIIHSTTHYPRGGACGCHGQVLFTTAGIHREERASRQTADGSGDRDSCSKFFRQSVCHGIFESSLPVQDAAFHPSTFGESLDAIIRLQERTYPQQKVPIILPFLADGILALGGPKSEGIFRVPGDGDSVSELKLRIDRGYYTLDGVNDPHVLASLMKLWLRELCDPLVPEEMYNECITSSQDGDACVRIVERLPTINRRVVLFVISFLQLFLEDRIQSVTKMTPANLALVMAPNLLRCNSDSMSVVFTNAQ
jgi:hypothetical protein